MNVYTDKIFRQDVATTAKLLAENPNLYSSINEDLLEYTYSKFLTAGNCAIDIGAHKGRHLLLLSKLVGNGKIIAFEPQPVFSLNLRMQFKNNQNISIENCALSDKEGMADFFIYTESPAESGLSPRTERMATRGGCKKISTHVKVLNDYIDRFSNLEFIKIDAESAEMNILLGGENLINRFRPLISVEFGDDVTYFNHQKTDLWDYCQKNKYHLCDAWQNIFPSKEEWKNFSACWDFWLIPQEKYNSVIDKIRA